MIRYFTDPSYSIPIGMLLLLFYPLGIYLVQKYFSKKIVKDLPSDPTTAVEMLWQRKEELSFRVTLATLPFLITSIIGAFFLFNSLPIESYLGWCLLGISLYVFASLIAAWLGAYEGNKILRGDTWTKLQMLRLLISTYLFFNFISASFVLTISITYITQFHHSIVFLSIALQVLFSVVLFIILWIGLFKLAIYGIGFARQVPNEVKVVFDEIVTNAKCKPVNLVIQKTFGGKVASAFALGRNIIITDYLLDTLSLAEFRALIAHELGHIVARHTNMRAKFFGITGILIISGVAIARSLAPSEEILLPVAIAISLWWLIIRCSLQVFRKHEHAADNFAADLIGDPALVNAMLQKVHLLAYLPKGKISWVPMTHPTMNERSAALGQEEE